MGRRNDAPLSTFSWSTALAAADRNLAKPSRTRSALATADDACMRYGHVGRNVASALFNSEKVRTVAVSLAAQRANACAARPIASAASMASRVRSAPNDVRHLCVHACA